MCRVETQCLCNRDTSIVSSTLYLTLHCKSFLPPTPVNHHPLDLGTFTLSLAGQPRTITSFRVISPAGLDMAIATRLTALHSYQAS